MADKSSPSPPQGRDRLAAALRENLKRRKAQARGRTKAADQPARDDTTPVAAGTVDNET